MAKVPVVQTGSRFSFGRTARGRRASAWPGGQWVRPLSPLSRPPAENWGLCPWRRHRAHGSGRVFRAEILVWISSLGLAVSGMRTSRLVVNLGFLLEAEGTVQSQWFLSQSPPLPLHWAGGSPGPSPSQAYDSGGPASASAEAPRPLHRAAGPWGPEGRRGAWSTQWVNAGAWHGVRPRALLAQLDPARCKCSYCWLVPARF